MLMNRIERIIAVALCTLFTTTVALGQPATQETEGVMNPAAQAVAEGDNSFAMDLYGQLRNADGNLFFSPYSVAGALAMVRAGAGGTTAAEMTKALKLPDLPPQDLSAGMAALSARFSASAVDQGYELHIADAMWGQTGQTFLPDYLDHLKTDFDAELNGIDFHDAQTAAGTINKWVSLKTNNRINNLISPGAINDQTKLILTNAIYFKGDWSDPFDKKLTHEAPWNDGKAASADGSTMPASNHISMMFKSGAFDYLKDNGLSVLQMPYKGAETGRAAGGDLAMLILLPDDPAGLGDLEQRLDSTRLKEIVSKLHREPKVEVSFPKFKLETSYEMSQTLAKMGMPTLFSDAADLSGIDGKRDLFVSGVVHKAFVQVDETGTEAAAATGVMVGAMAFRQRTVFTADHPFFFMIRDVKTGTILFMGRIVHPEA